MYYTKSIHFGEHSYLFNVTKGSLFQYNTHNKTSKQFDFLVNNIKNPFLLNERESSNCHHFNYTISLYAKLLTWLTANCYWVAYVLSFLRMPIFEDASVANMAYRKIMKNKNQSKLCLPRSIFIATTSKRFRKHGIMYIGCFFPSRNMHAWVIEDNMHADIYDRYWILYTPVVVMK